MESKDSHSSEILKLSTEKPRGGVRWEVSVALMCSALLSVLSVCNVYVQRFRKPTSLYLNGSVTAS